MIKRTIALFAILALVGLLPAVAQEPQEEMGEKAKKEMAGEAQEMAGEAKEMAADAEGMVAKGEQTAEDAEGALDKAKEMLESEAEGETEADADLPSLDELLASHYEALGGAETWAGIQAVRYEGTMAMGPGMEAPFIMTQKRPDQIRLEFTFQGMTGIQAYDGATAWMVMPFMGKTDPEEMPADMADQLKEQADIEGALFDWESKGHTVELLGAEEMEGTDVYKVKLTRDNGDVRYHFLDSEYFVTIKMEGRTSIQGQEVDIETAIGDYKEICLQTSVVVDDDNPCEGDVMMLPHSIESKPKGAPAGQVITITSAIFNPEDIAEDFFAMPPKPAVEEPAASEG